jgi:hypothetical protein
MSGNPGVLMYFPGSTSKPTLLIQAGNLVFKFFIAFLKIGFVTTLSYWILEGNYNGH